jgi:catechol 2,3-dioxygenase-like lactoylglutathione lyase family enzyme
MLTERSRGSAGVYAAEEDGQVRTDDIRYVLIVSHPYRMARRRLAGRNLLDVGRATDHDRQVDIRIQCLCIDTTDPARIASFWQAALGWRRTYEDQDQVCLEPPVGSPEDGTAPDLIFLRVPETKVTKNRLHLDLRPADQTGEVARLEALGARRVDVGQRDVGWVVMADPDGNEFDVLKALTPDELPPGFDPLGRRTQPS